MSRPWWASVVQWVAWGVLMSLTMGWLGRSRFRTRHWGEARLLMHPSSTLVVAVICSVLFSAALVASIVVFAADAARLILVIAILGSFTLASFALVAEYFVVRHEVGDEAIRFRKLTGRRGTLAWRDVDRVEFSTSSKWFRIRSRDGEVVRISAMLIGLPEFARLLLAGAIDPSTASLLHETAAGRPPSLWL